jgi:predicted GNAT family acetyltransferase
MAIELKHEPGSGLITAFVDGDQAGRIAYEVRDRERHWVVFSTQVPNRFEGHGVGSALARTVADAARVEGFTLVPTCWFVAGWLDRHPDYSDVLAN